MFFPEVHVHADNRLHVYMWLEWFIQALHDKAGYNSYWGEGYEHAVKENNEAWSMIQFNYNIYKAANIA